MAAWIVPAFLVLCAALSVPLVRANLRHGHHERPPGWPDPGPVRPFYGSMSYQDELALHHEARVGWPVDPVPWEHLASDERIEQAEEIGCEHGVIQLPGEPNACPWCPPSEAEVAASRRAHGYIPELDPGPQAGAPGPDQDSPGPAMALPKPGVEAGIERAVNAALKPPAGPGDLGPRARAVLDGYEGRLGARKWACT